VIRGAAAGVAALLVAGALGACGDKRVDGGKLQQQISDAVTNRVGARPKVRCPDQDDVRRGVRFTCDLTARDGRRAKVEVELLDGDGRFRYRVVPAG
jgi:hypothetical protein